MEGIISYFIIRENLSSEFPLNNFYLKNLDVKEALANGKYQYKYHIDGKPHFVYSWKLEPTDRLPAGTKAGYVTVPRVLAKEPLG